MPEIVPTPTPAPPKRGWMRRALRWFGVFLLFVALFHRPIFHAGVRLVLIEVAARQKVKLDVDLSGSIFTNLVLSDLRAQPNGAGPTAVRRIAIEKVRFDYSLPLLVKHGLGEFIQRYEVRNAYLEIDALPSRSEPERRRKRALAEDLNNLLGQPAAYADRVLIENFNLTVRSEKTVTQVAGFDLFLDPEKVGYLRVARLQIPGLPVWEKLAAETSYADRNFYIKDLQLAPELVLEAVNFDASQRAQDKGSMSVRARVFGGNLALSLGGSQLAAKGENLARSYDTTLRVDAAGISLEAAAAYFGAPSPPAARLERLNLLFTGEPEKPRTWKGRIGARFEALKLGAAPFEGAELDAAFDRGIATVKAVNLAAGKNSALLTATVGLPASVNDFPLSDVDATLQIDAPELATLTAFLPEPFTGAISGGGPITLHGGRLKTGLTLEVRDLASARLQIATAKLDLQVEKRLAPEAGPPLDNLTTQLRAEFTEVRAQNFTVDAARLEIENRNDLVTLHALEVRRAENTVSATGTYRVPRNFREFAEAPLDAKLTLEVPRLEAFGLKVKDHALTGRLQGSANLQAVNAAVNGELRLTGGDFQIGDYRAEKLAATVTFADRRAVIEQLALQFNATDQLVATGEVGLQAPFPYAGALLVEVKDLAVFQPLLTVLGAKQKIAGALKIDWQGKGEAAPVTPPFRLALDHTGQLDFALLKGRVDKTALTEIKLAGLYGPGFAQSTELQLISGPTSFTGSLEIKDGKLRLKDMNLAQAGLSVLTGYIFLPLNLANLKQPIPMQERVAANINATNLDLEKLLSSFGETSPVSGTVSANLVTGGTLLQPLGHLKFSGRKLKAKAFAGLDPADLDLDLHYSNKELTLDATARQPQMQPLTIKGHVPLDLESTVQNAKIDPTLPLSATIQLPPSSLAVVARLSPAVRKIEGTLGLDVQVAGTVEKPVLSGAAVLDLAQARMENENIPVIRAFKARLAFQDDTLTFNSFEGEVGGGTFKLGGTIRLPTLREPIFDLKVQSDEVLVLRNDSITVRADADVSLTGPLAAATVGGTVFVTHSRFFKEIDILPIALPGKAKPAPKSARALDTGVSFPQAPIRDWKFDLAIKTRPGDAFLVRGNLANGAAALDLRLAGTGLAPYLEGSIRIEEFKASLPFSTLSVSRGFVYFTEDAPFQPSIDLQAESQTRDYLVRAFIYGKSADPQIQLSSEPPLPYSDIVSLLATGVTAGEIGGNADVLASKAAMLAVQQLYRKIFLRGKTPTVDESRNGDGDFLDRFQLELGALDNRTGQRQVVSRVRLTDQLYLIGDIGTEGGFTGRLKYLIRFR